MSDLPDYTSLSFGELVDEIRAKRAAPAGGSVAALSATMAAALVAMCARFAEGHWDAASGAVSQAEARRARLEPLARADAEAYLAALEAMRGGGGGRQEERDSALAQALGRAAELPLEIAEAAADVAELAHLVCVQGNPNVRADAAASACLAASASRAAAPLVEVNLAAEAGDRRVLRARRAAEAARAASAGALAAGG
ncbi:MAG: cyclodeaminase/cyclohydrolase family protein [Gaiellales bacterium]